MSIIFTLHRFTIFAIVPVHNYELFPFMLLHPAHDELERLESTIRDLMEQSRGVSESTRLSALGLGMNVWLRGCLARLHAALFCQREEDTVAIEAAKTWAFLTSQAYAAAQAERAKKVQAKKAREAAATVAAEGEAQAEGGAEGGAEVGEPAEGGEETAPPSPPPPPRLSAGDVARAFSSRVTGALAAYFLHKMGKPVSGTADERRDQLCAALTEAWATDTTVKHFLSSICPTCEVAAQEEQKDESEEFDLAAMMDR